MISGHYYYLNEGLGDLHTFGYVNQIFKLEALLAHSHCYIKCKNRFASVTRDNFLSNFSGVDKLGRSASYILNSVYFKKLFR